MIDKDLQRKIQSCLAEYHTEAKPVATPPRSIQYHLRDQASRFIQDMINQDVIEERPINQPAPWASNIVTKRKADESLGMTLNTHNINKAITP